MKIVTLKDQYGQDWKIDESDPLWEEASKAVEENPDVVWSLEKLCKNKGFGWWTIYKKIDEVEEQLASMMPHPGKGRLIDIDKEYLPSELRDLLQRFGSYLATLHYQQGMLEAQVHGIKEGFKTSMNVALSQLDSKAATVSVREGEVISSNALLRETRKMWIEREAVLLLLQGWVKSFEAAYASISRIASIEISELSLHNNIGSV